LNFYGVTNLQVRPNGHNSGRELTNDCNGCHNTNGWGGGAAAKKSTAPQAATRATVASVVNGRGRLRPSLAPQLGAAQVAGAVPLRGVIRTSPGTPPSHFGVTSDCVSCHNGTLATGKGPTHVATNNACQNCHTTTAWLPARFDHRGVLASCVSCHNGALSAGKPAQHIQTTQDCGACHNTLDWKAVTFSHVGISGMCQSCHNGVTATGKQIHHASTTQDCGSCHNTLNWTITAPAKTLPPLLRGLHGKGSGTNGPRDPNAPHGPQR
jgi:hypothetical protein